MIRKIINIDEGKCNGCGLCVSACHEGAIELIEGKAKLVRENFCDGLGDCLPECPVGAIKFEEREAPAYDEEAVKKSKDMNCNGSHPSVGACMGSDIMQFKSSNETDRSTYEDNGKIRNISGLNQWPCQIKLLPVQAPFFDGADLLIAADCTAYAYADMHNDFMKDRITIIGCPKLDMIDYSEKLTEIISGNDIKSVTVVRMDVPCCGGIQMATENALRNSGKYIPWQVVVISRDGSILK